MWKKSKALGECTECAKQDVKIYKYKGGWVCRECMNPDYEINLREFISMESALKDSDIWLP